MALDRPRALLIRAVASAKHRYQPLLSHPDRPRWLALAVLAVLIALFSLSRLDSQTFFRLCSSNVPALCDVEYCGYDLVASRSRFNLDFLVVHDVRDQSRT